jgi:DNA-binding MarR family transcriptional regulator
MRSLVLDSNDKREAVTAAVGLSFIRVKALRRLTEGPASLSELAKRLSTDASYTSIVVDDLDERGLVTRTVDPLDRRARIVTLTRAGLSLAQQADRILAEPPAAFTALAAEELQTLAAILDQLLRSQTDEASGEPHPRP